MSRIGKLKESGKGGAVGGFIVQTRGEELPYKVVLEYEGSAAISEHPVATMREGESLIRDRSPAPAKVSKLREWNGPF